MDKIGWVGLGLLLVLIVSLVAGAVLIYWSWKGLKRGFVKAVMEPKCY